MNSFCNTRATVDSGSTGQGGRRSAGKWLAALSVAAVLLITGCESPIEEQTFPDVVFDPEPVLLLEAREITLEVAPQSSTATPGAQNLNAALSQTVESVLETWIASRFSLYPSLTTFAQVTVVKSEFRIVALEGQDADLEAAFTDEQAMRLEGELHVRFDVDAFGSSGNAVARVAMTQTLPESTTLADRDKALHAMLQNLATKLDRRLVKEMRVHLQQWIISP